MKKTILTILSLLAILNTTVIAEEAIYIEHQPKHQSGTFTYYPHFYMGIGYGLANAEDNYFYDSATYPTNTKVDFDSLVVQVGYEIYPFLSTEFRTWKSTTNGDYTISDGHVSPNGSYKNFQAWGVYLKPQFPISRDFSLYGLVGAAGSKVDGELDWNLVDDIGFSWGVGASFNVSRNLSVFLDYVSLYDDRYTGYYDYYGYYYENIENTTVGTFNIGITYKIK